MKIKKLIGLIVVMAAVLVCTSGCTMWAKLWFSGGSAPKPVKDPLAGWTYKPFPGWETPPYGHNTNHLDSAVVDDYQKFIADGHLDLFDVIKGFYEDGTGRHAVEFQAFPPKQNATWNFVLIYDKDNKRIKTIRYNYIKYQS